MTAATAIMAKLETAGVQLTLDGGQLRMRATTPPPPALLDEARAAKADLLALLRGDAGTAGVPLDDGGLPSAPCPACRKRGFWRAMQGPWRCQGCIPPDPTARSFCWTPINPEGRNQ